MRTHIPLLDPDMGSDAGSFIQRWLHELCIADLDIRAGMVLLSEIEPGDGPQLAIWPPEQLDLSVLIQVARNSMNRAHLVLARSNLDLAVGPHLIGLPLLDGERVRGALAIALHAEDGKAISDKMVWLARAGASMACGLFSVLIVESTPGASSPGATRPGTSGRRIHWG